MFSQKLKRYIDAIDCLVMMPLNRGLLNHAKLQGSEMTLTRQ
jgi:hypothetical protein